MSTRHRNLSSTIMLQNDVTTPRGAIARAVTIAALMGLACTQEPSESPPAVARDSAVPSQPAEIVSPIPPATEPATTEPARGEPSSGPGLGALTRELVEQARRTSSDPLRLVPDAAQYLVQVRPPELLAHPELQTVWTKAESTNPDVRTSMEVVRRCLGRLEAIEQVVLGFDAEGHVALVARAKGIGTEATWRCLRDETTTRGRSFDITLTGTPRGKGHQLRQSEGKGEGDLGYFVDDDTVVLVTKEWDAEVSARGRDEGTAAIDGQLASVASRVPPDAPLWVVGRIAGTGVSMLASTPMAGLEDVSFSLRVQGRDLELQTIVDAGDADDALRMRDELQRQFDQFESILPIMGFPASLGPKFTFVAKDDLLSLSLALTEDELVGLREGIEKNF